MAHGKHTISIHDHYFMMAPLFALGPWDTKLMDTIPVLSWIWIRAPDTKTGYTVRITRQNTHHVCHCTLACRGISKK